MDDLSRPNLRKATKRNDIAEVEKLLQNAIGSALLNLRRRPYKLIDCDKIIYMLI